MAQQEANLNAVDAGCSISQVEGERDIVREEHLSDLTLEAVSEQLNKNIAIEKNAVTAAKSTTHIKLEKRSTQIANASTGIRRTNAVKVTVRNISELPNDCLKDVFHYLDLLDALNLSRTCTRLFNFARAAIFPKVAKLLSISKNNVYNNHDRPYDRARPYYSLTTPLDKEVRMKEAALMYPIYYLGEFIEDLTFAGVGITIETNIENWIYVIRALIFCRNLKKLRFTGYEFYPYQTQQLQYRIQQLSKLNELIFEYSSGITNEWLATTAGVSKVRALTVFGDGNINEHFFRYFRNLSSLSIDCNGDSSEFTDIDKAFDNHSHTLHPLKHPILNVMKEVGSMKPDPRLYYLKCLGLGGRLQDNTSYIAELPYLKSLKIGCRNYSIEALLRTLSDNGIIEDLSIWDVVMEVSDKDSAPLRFNKLRCFSLEIEDAQEDVNMSGLLKIVTRSHMPEIHSFTLSRSQSSWLSRDHFGDLLRFIESKNGLKHICLGVHYDFEFVRQIIKILETPSSPRRPFLTLKMFEPRADREEMKVLHEYRHLINVTGCSAESIRF